MPIFYIMTCTYVVYIQYALVDTRYTCKITKFEAHTCLEASSKAIRQGYFENTFLWGKAGTWHSRLDFTSFQCRKLIFHWRFFTSQCFWWVDFYRIYNLTDSTLHISVANLFYFLKHSTKRSTTGILYIFLLELNVQITILL